MVSLYPGFSGDRGFHYIQDLVETESFIISSLYWRKGVSLYPGFSGDRGFCYIQALVETGGVIRSSFY